MSETTERDWVSEIGKPCEACLVEMVAALECDYERLEELRDERRDLQDEVDSVSHSADPEASQSLEALAEWDEENADELKELEEAAGECKDREEAEQRIHEDPLSVEVRSDWTTPGEEMTAGEFCILLSTGGPATRIIGELDEHGEPYRAWLEVQDWFKPWTGYADIEQDTLLTYARCFTFNC